jgi:NTP pyrophosphatase (non-canonical NTP hydrolase)
VEEAQEEAQEERKEIRHLHLESRLLAVVAAVAGQAQELLEDLVVAVAVAVRLQPDMQEPLGKVVRVEMQKLTRITTAVAVEDSPLLEALHQQPCQALVALAWIALPSSHR